MVSGRFRFRANTRSIFPGNKYPFKIKKIYDPAFLQTLLSGYNKAMYFSKAFYMSRETGISSNLPILFRGYIIIVLVAAACREAILNSMVSIK